MASKRVKKAKSSRKIPPWGRKKADLKGDMDAGLHSVSANVPLGNTGPTVVRGVMYGGVNNSSNRSTGPLRSYRGKYT